MKHLLGRTVAVGALALLLSNCLVVNINVHFPASKVESVAEDIESEVRDAVLEQEGAEGQSWLWPGRRGWGIGISFGMPSAHAAEEESIDAKKTNPVIRKIVESRKERFPKINDYLTAGYIGEATDGFLKELKDVSIPLIKLAEVRKTVKAENDERANLFKEIAKINDISDENLIRVQKIWAETNKKKLLVGQHYMNEKGEWIKKTKAEYERDQKELEKSQKE